jgi:menaquinone-dependent protoporphyrinogen oxidase
MKAREPRSSRSAFRSRRLDLTARKALTGSAGFNLARSGNPDGKGDLMRVLVSWGSKRGGTEGIARMIAAELEQRGIDATPLAARQVVDVQGYDAAIIGGALYANRWHGDACRLVSSNIEALRRIPVWLFSSGPLDRSADGGEIPPCRQVGVLMDRLGACGHATFGGRLERDAKGFPAASMAKKLSGDWRNPARIDAWAAEIAGQLPGARPRPATEPAGGSIWRLLAHGVAGWAICGALMGVLLQTVSEGWAIALHGIAVPLVFAAISVNYFRARGARTPLAAALAFTAIVALLDAGIVAALILGSFDMFTSLFGTWLPILLIFATTWAVGTALQMMPEKTEIPRPDGDRSPAPRAS